MWKYVLKTPLFPSWIPLCHPRLFLTTSSVFSFPESFFLFFFLPLSVCPHITPIPASNSSSLTCPFNSIPIFCDFCCSLHLGQHSLLWHFFSLPKFMLLCSPILIKRSSLPPYSPVILLIYFLPFISQAPVCDTWDFYSIFLFDSH